jgi:hypothetical protein
LPTLLFKPLAIITLTDTPSLDHDDSAIELEAHADFISPGRAPALAPREQVNHFAIANHTRKSPEPHYIANPDGLYHQHPWSSARFLREPTVINRATHLFYSQTQRNVIEVILDFRFWIEDLLQVSSTSFDLARVGSLA